MTIDQQPYDIDAEKATLGSILRNRDAIIAVAGHLKPVDFYLERHAQIYAAMLACYARQVPPDAQLLAAELRNRKQLDLIGGALYLADLMAEVPTSYHADYYAGIVADHATRRRLIQAGGQIAAMAYDTSRDPRDLVADANAKLLEAAPQTDTGGLVPIGSVLHTIYERICAGERSTLMTGIDRLDQLLGGLGVGDLCIAAGRPGHGKTTLALSIAENVVKAGHRVAFYSFEMSRVELGQRLMAMRSGVSSTEQRQQEVGVDQLQQLIRAMSGASELPLAIDDRRGLTVTDLRTRTLRYAMQAGGVGLVVIDYLQLMVTRVRSGMNYSQAIGEISRGLKALAREVEAPVLALSQLNRELDKRASKTPQLSDLRESGDIEADADQIVFIVRPQLYDDETDKHGIAELHLAKNRHGPTGQVDVRFDANRTQIQNLTYRTDFRAAAGY